MTTPNISGNKTTLDIKQMREQLRVLNAAILACAHSVMILDRAGKIVFVNSALLDLTGYKQEELIGQNIRTFRSGFHEPSFYDKIWQTILSGTAWQGEMINKRRDGTFYNEETTITPLLDATGQVTHFVAVQRDITEQKRLQEQHTQNQKMESMGRMAGGIAHDFNNILQTIIGFCEIMLMNTEAQNAQYSDLTEILNAANRAATLTRQLLAFSRNQMIELKPLQINEIIRNMANMLARLIGENIRLDLELADDPHQINADSNQLELLLTNLALNARDAMPQGGRLTIGTSNITIAKQDAILMPESSVGEFVCIAVSDTGIGMDETTAAHLFEPFFSTKRSNTGLGLASVYGIAKQHNGWINVYSQIGQGSTFKLYLPALNTQTGKNESQLTRPELTHKHAHGHGEKILLVEDEQSVRNLAAMILRANGYQVAVASNADEAMTLFAQAQNTFDLLFSDVVLPDQNGLELAKQCLAQNPGLHVLLSSGYSDVHTRWPAIRAMRLPFLAKPYPIAKLLETVSAILNQKD